jgi:hypothetical protein
MPSTLLSRSDCWNAKPISTPTPIPALTMAEWEPKRRIFFRLKCLMHPVWSNQVARLSVANRIPSGVEQAMTWVIFFNQRVPGFEGSRIQANIFYSTHWTPRTLDSLNPIIRVLQSTTVPLPSSHRLRLKQQRST